MKNISFDNPYWLFIAIPLLFGILIPVFIAIRKENRSRSVVLSTVIHILIIALVTLGAAGMVITANITRTEVIVVADVSHSARDEYGRIDGYISELSASLPDNATLGVVCFGKDYTLHTPLGEPVTAVSEAKVDKSATDIASALEYASTLFSDDVLRRIVLITDGASTVSLDSSDVVGTVEKLVLANISIDAIYLDSNIKEGATEAQVSRVDHVPSTYLGHDTSADVLVQSNTDIRAIVSLYKDGQKLTDRAAELSKGFNIVNFDLPTDAPGSFNYEIRVSIDGDSVSENNNYSFSQRVTDELRVLLLGEVEEDIRAAIELYSDRASIDVHYLTSSTSKLKALSEDYAEREGVSVKQKPFAVPCSVEQLSDYDEILLVSMDVRVLDNVSAFIGGVETVVSKYGKSLVTIGDTKIQNKTDSTLESLENMLPVKFGNSAQDSKLYAIVIDTSRSMYTASRLSVAKQAAVHLLNILNDEDEVVVVSFAGDISIIQPSTKAANREQIAKKINDLKPTQGTSVAGGLKAALDLLEAHDSEEKQIMLISDGMNYSAEIVTIDGVKKNARELASYMADKDIRISTMNPYNTDPIGINLLSDIASLSGGKYYYVKDEKSLESLIFSSVADDITESVVMRESVVHIEIPADEAVEGISFLPAVGGFVQSKGKVSASTVLSVDYKKPSGSVVRVPLYSYWKYGNGRVSSLMTALSGDWLGGFSGEMGGKLFDNVLSVNIPNERIDTPYSVNVDHDGLFANIELIPAIPDPFATVDVTLIYPGGEEVTQTLIFGGTGYFHRFDASKLGTYGMKFKYTSDVGEFYSEHSFALSYYPEYDSFTNFDPSTLYAAIRHHGRVIEGGVPDISDVERISTFRLTFMLPFMIAAAVLYVIDIIIRKIKWHDIRTLFKRSAPIKREEGDSDGK